MYLHKLDDINTIQIKFKNSHEIGYSIGRISFDIECGVVKINKNKTSFGIQKYLKDFYEKEEFINSVERLFQNGIIKTYKFSNELFTLDEAKKEGDVGKSEISL